MDPVKIREKLYGSDVKDPHLRVFDMLTEIKPAGLAAAECTASSLTVRLK